MAGAWRSHEPIQEYLRNRGIQEPCWYAISFRNYSRNGAASELVEVRYPCSESLLYSWMLEAAMATAAGRRDQKVGDTNFSTARVHTIPDDLVHRDPMQALVELQAIQDLPEAQTKER